MLDKTKMDWQDYKAENTAVEEELGGWARAGRLALAKQFGLG